MAAVGFAAFLMCAGLLTLQTGVLARWTGIVALNGAVAFLVTFLTVLGGRGDGSVFGYAFFPAILSLVTWTIATSIARYRAVAGAMPAIAFPGDWAPRNSSLGLTNLLNLANGLAMVAIIALATGLGVAHGLGGILGILSGISTGQQLADGFANRKCGHVPTTN